MPFPRSLRRQGRPAREPGPEYVHAGPYATLPPGGIRRVDGLPVVLCRSADQVYALHWICPHAAARLAGGRVVDGSLECPLHGARFALDTGRVRLGPARRGLLSYPVRIEDGEIYVAREPTRPAMLDRLATELRLGAQATFRRRAR